MNKPILEESKDFDSFLKHQNQQPMSDSHVKKIAELMKRVGFLPSKPIQVCKYKDKYGIIDGHHRFAAARMLGIPFYYVVEDIDHSDLIGEENALVRKWASLSFVKLFASKGSKDYQTLLEYAERIPLALAASLLIGNVAYSGNANPSIPIGTFKIKTTKSIDTILHVIDSVSSIAPEIKKRSYICALSMLLYVPDFSVEQLIIRIKSNPSAIVAAADKSQALDFLEEVFNFRSKIKINLAFQAKELARGRSVSTRN
jgi:hypothetical protein